jgi:orotate phosphoribosyltransferase
MDETTKKIIDSIIRTSGTPREIAPGVQARVYFECQALSPTELARLAAQAVGHVAAGTFDVAVGIAYGGIFFAAAVAGGHDTAILQTDHKIYGADLRAKKVIVVDEVVVTGKRVLAAVKTLQAAGAQVVGIACIIDRSAGKFTPAPALPLWSAYQTNLE